MANFKNLPKQSDLISLQCLYFEKYDVSGEKRPKLLGEYNTVPR
jgi:hypothetical protein